MKETVYTRVDGWFQMVIAVVRREGIMSGSTMAYLSVQAGEAWLGQCQSLARHFLSERFNIHTKLCISKL